MPDEETPPIEGQAPETPTVPPSLVSADGTLVDGWQQHAPEGYEDLKDDKTLSTFKNVFALGKSYSHVRKQVPMDKMPRPSETWGFAEWDEFHKAGGRPDTAKDYNIKRHKDISEDAMPQSVIDGFQEVLFKHGASKKLVEALVAYNDEQTLKMMKTTQDAEVEQNTQLWDQLHDEWGRAYDQRVGRAEKAIERGTDGSEGFYRRVLDKVNKDADLIKWAANIEDHFSEKDLVEGTRVDTPADIQAQIDELRADPRFSHADKNVRKPIIDKINRLTEQKLREKQPA